MRKTLIALMLAAALPAVAMASPGDGPSDGPGFGKGPGFGPGPGRHRAPYAELNLTPDQRQQIDKLVGGEMHGDREITERYLQKLPAADQQAMKNEIKAGQDKTQADIRALLKPDQQKQFDAIKQKEDQRRAEWKEFQAWKASKGQTADKTQ
ncbi:Spy/CpxP family protein refolding chaperone [Pseudomonas sp. dw_358]|uniref:Spy/CpxP family protein refolding chaperone n=1 Tax=Pseudomonas sp. dw_358 TaxID=2720083 RepID=UPI001BD66720|nr:Spy/CpxP family protein refolding chaperone [Pseudomonas sp. dw_358]